MVVGRVRDLKHGSNGARGAEISKIRHLGPKQHHFGLCYRKKKALGVLCTARQ